MILYRFHLLLIIASLFNASTTYATKHKVEEFSLGIKKTKLSKKTALQKINSYDSDSEDEEGYTYKGLPHLTIPADKNGKKCIVLSRGIHFAPSKFTRLQRSQMRRTNDEGSDIFCSAAYDLADKPLDSSDTEEVEEKAIEIREQIKDMEATDRNKFQQIYSNQYDGFHDRLGTNRDGGIFAPFESKKNPQVSTSEDFVHSEKYGYGLKYLGSGIESLDPEYDTTGKPKHPYFGKLFVILAAEDTLDELAPYFVVHGHANDAISISNHFSKNVLSEREVSIPGLIPGDCVVLSIPLRVPSFEGDYKSWYQEKFGISKSSYTRRKKSILEGNKETFKTLLTDVILPHLADKIKDHIIKECKTKNIRLVYKQLNGSFGTTLPSLVLATDCKKRIQRKARA
ncbi:MAG: hypothetical protein M1114_02980 [Candidatus Dependentiae bacterium]|nr:hypothetical protein [Candidatus Dependentiae bacterium]